jgi:hypothetical protein
MHTVTMSKARMRQPQRAYRTAVVVVCAMLLALSLWSPSASAQPKLQTEVVPTSIEAWYYLIPGPALPPLPTEPEPANPYGEDTLHVGITAGEEDSRTYISLNVEDLPLTFEIEKGYLELPIDPDNGTFGETSAHAQVCLADPPTESVEGSFEEPPEVDCKTKADATYRKKPYPRLIASLTEFGADLAFSGLAVLASKKAIENSETWHVAFYGKKNKAKEAKPIQAKLSFTKEDPFASFDDSIGSINEDFGAPLSLGGGADISSVSGPSFGNETLDTAQQPDAPTQAESPVEALPATVQPASQTRPATIVWYLPLVLFALASYLASALATQVVIRRRSLS